MEISAANISNNAIRSFIKSLPDSVSAADIMSECGVGVGIFSIRRGGRRVPLEGARVAARARVPDAMRLRNALPFPRPTSPHLTLPSTPLRPLLPRQKMVTRTKKIFVGGLSAPTTLEDVKNYFEQFGPVPSLVYLWINIAQTRRDPSWMRVRAARKVVLDIGMLSCMPLRYRAGPHSRFHAWYHAVASSGVCVRDGGTFGRPVSPHVRAPNANCLRISNEPLKCRTQWLRPPEAKAAGTRARNGAVNESPTRPGPKAQPLAAISTEAVYQSVVTTLHGCRLSSGPLGSVCPDSCIVPALAGARNGGCLECRRGAARPSRCIGASAPR
ncbi:unnamed protein product, partial [Iphiclides podalirius]